MTSDPRVDPPYAADEFTTLDSFLAWLQQTILLKIRGLSDEQLRRPATPSGWCPLGVVKHQAYVHRFWFRVVFQGEDVAMPWSAAAPDADWRVEPGETAEAIIALYEEEVARARAIARAASLDAMARSPARPVSLRWIMVHMVEEVARHCGHLDIVREQIDGATGE